MIPLKADFDEWLRLADARLQVAPAPFEAWRLSKSDGTVTPAAAVAYLRAVEDALRDAQGTLRARPVGAWLAHQREFLRARGLVEGKKAAARRSAKGSEIAPQTTVEGAVDAIFRRAAESASHAVESKLERASAQISRMMEENPELAAKVEADPGRLRTAVHDSIVNEAVKSEVSRYVHYRNPVHSWEYSVVHALGEYYHGEVWKISLELHRSLGARAAAAKDALTAVAGLWAEAESHGFLRRRPRAGVELEQLAASLATLRDNLRFPVQRNDKHAPERLFVFRLQKANRQA